MDQDDRRANGAVGVDLLLDKPGIELHGELALALALVLVLLVLHGALGQDVAVGGVLGGGSCHSDERALCSALAMVSAFCHPWQHWESLFGTRGSCT